MFLLSCEYKWATHLAKNSFIVYNKNIIEVGHGVDIDSSFRIFRFNITNESPKYFKFQIQFKGGKFKSE